MAVLVTGGAGFVGSHLVDTLCKLGKEVVVIDDLSSGSVANLSWAIERGNATFVYGDVAQEPEAIRTLVRSATASPLEAIYHLASPASPEAYGAHPWETLRVNAVGTMSLIELALQDDARMLYTSTSEVYGDPAVNPQPESYFGNVNSVGPRACYDEGKRFGEAAMSVAVARRGLDGRIVRLFNCYGPRMQCDDGRLIPALIDAALKNEAMPVHGTGKQTRSITYVDDVVRGLLHVWNLPQLGCRPVNLGNDEELSVCDIAQRVAKTIGVAYNPKFFPARPEDPQQRRPDLTFARSIGWAPTTSVDEGLAKTVAWVTAPGKVFTAA